MELMGGIHFFTLALVVLFSVPAVLNQNHSFSVDNTRQTFLKDGKPFRYVSGSMHYSRVHPYYWKDRLVKMKIGGLNAVQTYVPWNIHNPKPDEYVWTGLADLEKFLQVAQEVGLVVLLRSGPYICGEWEFGGLPAWLLTINPNMVLRTSDPSYISAVDRWYDVMLPKIKPYLYENGGPIIMVQIENEYGSYFACDYDYLRFLYHKAQSILGKTQVLYSTDGAGVGYLKCGTMEGVYSTVDFGVSYYPERMFKAQREWEPDGPLVNSEFYTGWLDHWGSPHSEVKWAPIAKSLDDILSIGANVNLYMFEGGTNFGYWNGANSPPYQPVPTSYDYDGPLNETGDITDKYIAIRQVISKYYTLPPTPIPANTPKYPYGYVDMNLVGTVQDLLEVLSGGSVTQSKYPLSMEEIKFYYGFILYRHVLKKDIITATPLMTNGTRDRGYVMVDGVPMGMFNRELVWKVNITGKAGQYLDIFVENQGRIGFGTNMNFNRKGIIENVTLIGSMFEDWEIYPIDLDNINATVLNNFKPRLQPRVANNLTTPSIYFGKIPIPDTADQPQDTFLDPSLWVKGQAVVNGFNIGRYWPGAGPQVTLSVPKPLLMNPPDKNILVILELEGMNCMKMEICKMIFTDKPFINWKIPHEQSSVRNIGYGFPYHKYH